MMDPSSPESSFQCTYDANGNWVPEAGNYDYKNPDADMAGHVADDIFPSLFPSLPFAPNGDERPDSTQTYPNIFDLPNLRMNF